MRNAAATDPSHIMLRRLRWSVATQNARPAAPINPGIALALREYNPEGRCCYSENEKNEKGRQLGGLCLVASHPVMKLLRGWDDLSDQYGEPIEP
jgi:hypothetical protein